MHGNVLSRTITPLGRPKLSNYTEYQQVGTRTKKYTYRRKKTKHCYPHCIYLKHFSVSRSSHQMCNSISLRVLSTQKTLWIFLETALCHMCQQQTIWTLRVDEDQNFLGLLTSRAMFFAPAVCSKLPNSASKSFQKLCPWLHLINKIDIHNS